MKPNNQSSVQVQSNITGDKAVMGIDPAAFAHIMAILTDLYSDPELAVIREYSTNAWDAQVEAGITRPIEVNTPTALSPFFTVRDFGIGLTRDDIHNIYSKYGTSTKRGTNAQNGMLGLGCKSALTYAAQFTVTSVKDGNRVQVVVSRDDDGGGSMTVVDESPTTDENGTEVTVPVKQGNTMEAKAREFYKFWDSGTVILNGKPPVRFTGLRMTDDLYVVESTDSTKDRYGYRQNSVRKDLIVMGNVAYPLPNQQREIAGCALEPGKSLVAFVPIGSVNFVPSREALMDTKNTTAALATVAATFQAEAGKSVQREIDKAPDAASAIQTMLTWDKTFPGLATQRGAQGKHYTYKGKNVPTKVERYTTAPATDWQGKQIPGKTVTVPGFTISPKNGYKLSSANERAAVDAEAWPQTVFVTGYDVDKFTANHKHKLNSWAASQNLSPQQYALVADDTLPELDGWIDAKQVVDYDTIKKVKITTVQPKGYGPPRLAGSYDIYVNGDYKHGIAADKFNTNKAMFHIHGNQYAARPFVQVLTKHNPGCTVVCLPGNRIAKYERVFPNSVTCHTAIKALAEKWSKKLTYAQRVKLIHLNDRYSVRQFDRLNPSRVDDPALVEAIKIAKMDATALTTERDVFNPFLGRDWLKADWTNPLDEAYPLYDSDYLGSMPDHVYNYLNDSYARTQQAQIAQAA